MLPWQSVSTRFDDSIDDPGGGVAEFGAIVGILQFELFDGVGRRSNGSIGPDLAGSL